MWSRGSRGHPRTLSIAALCNKTVNCVAPRSTQALTSSHVRSSGNEPSPRWHLRDRVGARHRSLLVGVDMACGRSRSPRVLGLRRPLCRRAAPWRGHRAGRCACGAGSCERPGHLRRAGTHTRADGHHRNGWWPQGVPDASRAAAGEAWCSCRGGGSNRRARSIRRSRARCAIRPSRRARRRRRHVCRSAVLASAAGCHQPSAGTRVAARPNSGGRSASASGRCDSARRGSSSGAAACFPDA